MDEIIHLEILSLKQQLEIASKDISELTGCCPSDYLHDLSTRDYYEEIEQNKNKEGMKP